MAKENVEANLIMDAFKFLLGHHQRFATDPTTAAKATELLNGVSNMQSRMNKPTVEQAFDVPALAAEVVQHLNAQQASQPPAKPVAVAPVAAAPVAAAPVAAAPVAAAPVAAGVAPAPSK